MHSVGFIHDNFLLKTDAAQRLYREYAEPQPILDYHNHLPPRDIAENRRFANLFEIWLEGDHYKWRAMRANGVDERFITGDATPYEKFMAWARTVPYTLRNPLYHWTHLELKRYFGIDELLNEHTAPEIWWRTNEMLAKDDLTTQGILRKFRVRALCTTDDPADDLGYHRALAEGDLETEVYPAFRPDKGFRVDDPALWNAWVDRLAATANVVIRDLRSFLDALKARHDDFHDAGCRLSDHGLSTAFADFCDEAAAARIFDRARQGKPADATDQSRFASYLMLRLSHLDAVRGWTKQLHLGAQRGVNSTMLGRLGPDTGYDSIGDKPQIDALGAFLDRLEREGALPKMVLYNVNPTDNYAFATMAGNFQGGGVINRIQFGSGWWFLDQKEGIEWQINALSNCGLLARFIGMLTDSRSFMSYPRHEYFRRVLCNMLGSEIESGELPDDIDMVGKMVSAICYSNAHDFLKLPSLREAKVCA
jgi:glucuronate isomerase